MKKTILLSVLVIVFCPFAKGQNLTDNYTKNKIIKELFLSKNTTTGAWDTSFYLLNQLSPQCAILKSSHFWEDFSTGKLYEASRDSVVYLPNGGVDVYDLDLDLTTNTLVKTGRQRLRNRIQTNGADTSSYQEYSMATNSYKTLTFGLSYYNKWGKDSFTLERSYRNNVLTDTVFILTSKTDNDGNYTHLAWALYDTNGQLSSFNQKSGFTYVNKKLITQRDTSVSDMTLYFAVTDFTYDANGQVSVERYTSFSTSDTTKRYSRTRYITRNAKNKPLESIQDKLENGVWVEDTRNLYTYQSDTLEILNKSYGKAGTQWVEYNREIHEYCLPIQNAIEVLDKTLDISLSPNPTNGQLNIQFADNDMAQTPFDLAIFNNSGQLMYQKTNCTASQTLNVEHLKDGFYVAKIVQNGRFKTQKLIILH